MTESAFWLSSPLGELTASEWESLCDGCGRCCLQKLEDEESGELFYTSVACRHFDLASGRCGEYGRRTELVPDCVRLTPDNVAELDWMPHSCAYRLLAEGKPLPGWHPLRSGDPESVRTAGIAVGPYAVLESELDDPDDLEPFILPSVL